MRIPFLEGVLLLLYCLCKVRSQFPSVDSCYNNSIPVFCQPRSEAFTRRRAPSVNSTCGSPRTNFCERTISLGQVTSTCSAICDEEDPLFRHPPSYLTDFVLDPTWWQSENSLSTEQVVSIDFSLGILVQIDTIDMEFESFIPSNFRILKSTDYGQTYTDFHNFASSCMLSYGVAPDLPLVQANETSVLCEAIGNHNPRHISFVPLFGRPSFNDSVPGLSDALYNFISATDIRLLLVEHYPIPNLAPDDLGYYYALQDVSIIGQCQCNGHGYNCLKVSDPSSPARYACECGHNTTGINCERCSDFYQDVPWQSINGSNNFECKPCNCNGHSTQCRFDPVVYEQTNRTSGGVCLNCDNNRAGRNCERCADFFYPEGQSSNFSCTACSCNAAGSLNSGDCAREPGSGGILPGDCRCKANTQGRQCDTCRPGYFNLSADNPLGCQRCECFVNNSLVASCDNVTGSCDCKPNTVGARCDQCLEGFYLPDPASDGGCVSCDCNLSGSMGPACELVSGQCTCKDGVGGRDCSEVLPNYFIRGIDYLIREAEEVVGGANSVVIMDPSSYFTGFGYFGVNEGVSVIEFGLITAPVSGLYRIVIRYTLSRALQYNSSTLTVSPAMEGNSGPASCPGSSTEVTDLTRIEFTGWHLGMGRSVTRTACLRGMRSYNFTLSDFNAGGSADTATLLIDSLLLVPVDVATPIFSDSQVVSRYLDCVAAYSSLATVPSAPSFCRQAIFDVSTDIYDGAAPCSCDGTGTVVGTVCAPLGGQCMCLPNVRGRTCDACYPGTYDLTFTGCRACLCDPVGSTSPYCEPVSGNCSCLDNVAGRDCSACSPGHWGLQSPRGCINCNCNLTGSVSSQCDMVTGACSCAPLVTGYLCDRCQDLSYGFSPSGCSSCNCNSAGSTSSFCDDVSGQCPCRAATGGRDCSQCVQGTFNLDSSNMDGCEPCFCNGLSSSCRSAMGFYGDTISTSFSTGMLQGWTTSGSGTLSDSSGSGMFSMAGSLFGGDGLDVNANSSLYLVAPRDYLGNQLNSYSQYIRLNVQPSSSMPTTFRHAVLLEGSGMTLGIGYTQTTSGFSALLRETAGWVNVDTLADVTNRQFKMVLSSLTRLAVSVSFDTDVVLSSIEMETAVPSSQLSNTSMLEMVSSVEECSCPANYTGLSCQFCSSGYTRTSTGRCELCQCNGLSSSCEPETGVCFNCSMSSTGPSCDRCESGTYGDPTRSIECLPCPCPLTTPPGQFTNECQLTNEGTVQCMNCPVGHTGNQCESCVNGYFGDPTGAITGTPTRCSDCTCSGNIDLSDPNSCDRVTGVCNCVNNTAGQQCQRCADGFYGDAVMAKNCTACDCNIAGSVNSTCTSDSGRCSCRKNVAGRQCGNCLPGYFGFGSTEGCRECNCSLVGAVGLECGPDDGQCTCQPGVTGRTCDQCMAGFYGFSNAGCTACSCSPSNSEASMCDVVTGQCMCLPGATGNMCNQCLQNYFMVNNTCTSCPKCYQDLEDVYNSSLTQLMSSERDIAELSSRTMDLTPFDDRLSEYQLNASSLQVTAAMIVQRQNDLLFLYNQLLTSVSVTLQNRSEQVNSTVILLENDFTTIYIFAISAQSLMDRTLADFVMVTKVLDEVENVCVPDIMAQVSMINQAAMNVNDTTMDLQTLSRNISREVSTLRNLTSTLMSESQILRSEAEMLQDIQEEVRDGIRDLHSSLPSIRDDAEDASFNLTELDLRIRILEQRVRLKFGQIPDIPDADRVRNLTRYANESNTYARVELLAEIQRQQRNFSVVNETYTSNLMRFEALHGNISNIRILVDSHLQALQAAYAQAQNITSEGHNLIQTAEMVADNLENFTDRTFLVQSTVNEVLSDIDIINNQSMDALAQARQLQSLAGETERNIIGAKELARNASAIANMSLEDIYSVNSSSIISAINSSLQSSTQALYNIQILSIAIDYYINNTIDIGRRVYNVQTNISSLADIVNITEHARNTSSEYLSRVQDAFQSLQPVDLARLEGIRQLLNDTRAALEEADIYGTYQRLSEQLEAQRTERMRLESELDRLSADIEHLRRVNATLPTTFPDRCN